MANKPAFEFRPLPRGQYRTICADPPWDYSRKLSSGGTSGYSPVHHSRGGNRGAANHYRTLTLDQLKLLPVQEAAAPEAHLYLWTTGAFIAEAHELASAWGFAPKGVVPWIKVKKDAGKYVARDGGNLVSAVRMGMGKYVRWCSEFVVFGVRGKLAALNNDVLGVIFAERGRHSKKPAEFYDMVERLSPGPRLELFARDLRSGYQAWGDEL